MTRAANGIAEAVAALKAGRPLRAEELCRDYLLMDPGSVSHISLLGHALMRQGRLDEAAAQAEQAIELAPELPFPYEDLGSVRALQGRLLRGGSHDFPGCENGCLVGVFDA